MKQSKYIICLYTMWGQRNLLKQSKKDENDKMMK